MRKIEAMYAFYGKSESGRCGDCPHLFEGYHHDKKYIKCRAYGLSHSEATDWRKKWCACGLMGKPLPEGENPVKDRIPWRKQNDPGLIEGQISMDDLLQKGE